METKVKNSVNKSTLRRAIADLEGGKYDRFTKTAQEILDSVRVCYVHERTKPFFLERFRYGRDVAPVEIEPCRVRKIAFCGEFFTTYEFKDGRVLLSNAESEDHIQRRMCDDWYVAYRCLVWHYAMESEAIPMSLSGSVGKAYYAKNHFSGDSKWS